MGNPLDRPLEDVVAHTIVAALMGNDMFIHDLSTRRLSGAAVSLRGISA